MKYIKNNWGYGLATLVFLVLMAYGIAAADDYTAVYEANKPSPTNFVGWWYVIFSLFFIFLVGCFYGLWSRRQSQITAMQESRALSQSEARDEDERRERIRAG